MSERRRELLIIVLAVLLLARYVALACYAHPWADDFSYAYTAFDQPFAERLARERMATNGRWFSNILVLRSPLVLGSEGVAFDRALWLYRMVPLLLMALMAGSLFALLRAAAGTLHTTRRTWIVVLGLLLLALHLMPHVGEAFYWYTGAVTYTLPVAALFTLAALAARWGGSADAAPAHTVGRVLGGLALLAVVMGSNETIACCTVWLLALASVGAIRARWRYRHALLAMLLVAGGLLLYMALAPGNTMRGGYFPQRADPLRTLGYTVAYSGRYVLYLLISPLTWLAALAVLRWERSQDRNAPAMRTLAALDHRWLLVALAGTIALCMALPVWATGILGQLRTSNTALLITLPLLFLTLLSWDLRVGRSAGWGARILGTSGPRASGVGRTERLLWVVVPVLLLAARNDGLVSADLQSGRAARYDAQCQQRYRLVRDAVAEGRDELVVPTLVDMPRSLGALDITSDPDHWLNFSMARYFGGLGLALSAAPQREAIGPGSMPNSSAAKRASWP